MIGKNDQLGINVWILRAIGIPLTETAGSILIFSIFVAKLPSIITLKDDSLFIF